jgi:hypothetical protein
MRAKIPNRISSRSVASVTPGLLGTYCGWESGIKHLAFIEQLEVAHGIGRMDRRI